MKHLQEFLLQQLCRPLGMDPNRVKVGLAVSLVISAFLVAYFLRETLDEIIRYKVQAPLRGGFRSLCPL